MITANSIRAHRVDTSLHGGMTNLNAPATEPGPLTQRDFAPQRRPLLVRIWRACVRAVLLPIYRLQLACLVAERENYTAAGRPGSGIRLGPEYLKNAAFEQRRLEGRISFLDARIDY